MATDSTSSVMQRPGGKTYHQASSLGPVERVLEHRPPGDLDRVAETKEGQRRLGEDPTAITRTALAKISGSAFGKMWRG